MRRLLLVLALTAGCGTSETPSAAADVAPDVPDLAAEPADPGPTSIFDDIDDDVPVPWDLPEVDLVEANPDVQLDAPGAFSSCPTLGVSPHWKGTFQGLVTYSMPKAGG